MTQGFLKDWGPILDFCVTPCLLPSVCCIYGGQLRFIDSWMEAEFYKGNDSHRENNLQIAKAGMGSVAKGGVGKDLTWKTECKKAVLSYCLSSLAYAFLPVTILLPPSWLCHLANAFFQYIDSTMAFPSSCLNHLSFCLVSPVLPSSPVCPPYLALAICLPILPVLS